MLALYRLKSLIVFIAFVLFFPSFGLTAAGQGLEVDSPSGAREDEASLDKLLKAVTSGIGITRPPLAGEFPEAIIEKDNIGGSWPGVNDMSTLGYPGEFANCLAEIEGGNLWGPLHAELDFSKESNVVTTNVLSFEKGFSLQRMARVMQTLANPTIYPEPDST